MPTNFPDCGDWGFRTWQMSVFSKCGSVRVCMTCDVPSDCPHVLLTLLWGLWDVSFEASDFGFSVERMVRGGRKVRGRFVKWIRKLRVINNFLNCSSSEFHAINPSWYASFWCHQTKAKFEGPYDLPTNKGEYVGIFRRKNHFALEIQRCLKLAVCLKLPRGLATARH